LRTAPSARAAHETYDRETGTDDGSLPKVIEAVFALFVVEKHQYHPRREFIANP
jgi:hypothetical protein